jgi:hypothetical protein
VPQDFGNYDCSAHGIEKRFASLLYLVEPQVMQASLVSAFSENRGMILQSMKGNLNANPGKPNAIFS